MDGYFVNLNASGIKMKNNIKIYQNYIQDDDLKELDPAFIPNDWRHNPAPEHREIGIFFDND